MGGVIGSSITGGLVAGGIYAMVGLGMVLSAAALRAVNLSGGDMLVMGGFSYLAFSVLGLPPVWAAGLAVAAGAVGAMVIERAALRHLHDAPHSTVVLATLAIAWILRGCALVVWGHDPLVPPSIAGSSGSGTETAAVVGCAVLSACVCDLWLKRSHAGRALRAIADDPRAASAAGVDPAAARRLAFAAAGALAAVGGILAGPVTLLVYDGGIGLLMRGIAAAIIGGMRHPLHVLAGALSIGLLESLAAGLWSSLYKDVLTFCLLLVVLATWKGSDRA